MRVGSEPFTNVINGEASGITWAPGHFVAGHFVATTFCSGTNGRPARKNFVAGLFVAVLVTKRHLNLYHATEKLTKKLDTNFNDIISAPPAGGCPPDPFLRELRPLDLCHGTLLPRTFAEGLCPGRGFFQHFDIVFKPREAQRREVSQQVVCRRNVLRRSGRTRLFGSPFGRLLLGTPSVSSEQMYRLAGFELVALGFYQLGCDVCVRQIETMDFSKIRNMIIDGFAQTKKFAHKLKTKESKDSEHNRWV